VSGINGFPGTSSASGVRSSAAAAIAELEERRKQSAPAEPSGSNKVWFAVVGIIVIAICLIGYTVFGGR
jgi:hypothetical protein